VTDGGGVASTSDQDPKAPQPTAPTDPEHMPIDRIEKAESSDGQSVDALIGELLDEAHASPERRSVIRREILRSHHGPLPDGATLAEYQAVDPRLVDEVIEGAKQNRLHRYEMDRGLASTARLSLVFSAALIGLAMVAAVVLAWLGHPVVGALFGVGGLGAIIATMIRGGGEWRGRGHGGPTNPK
jgi:uncharacterized membrane protein